MEKLIKIGGKDYKIKSSAFTLFSYKNETQRDFLKDLKHIYNVFKDFNKDDNSQENLFEALDSAGDALEIITKLTYVMIKEADKNQVTNYEDFLKGIDNLFSESDWFMEVIDVATATF